MMKRLTVLLTLIGVAVAAPALAAGARRMHTTRAMLARPATTATVEDVPTVPVNPDNYLTISERAGIDTQNYPVQLGRPFIEGEIADAPLVLLDGVPVATQAGVRTRWPDGSVRHAVVSFLIPHLAAGASVKVQFANQPESWDGGLMQEQMLAPEFDFDAIVQLAGSQTQSASARRMLSDGSWIAWLSGPVSTTVILADHTTARSYDMGSDAHRAFRPIVHATFWPAVKKVHVRVIGEIANTEALQDEAYDLTISAGAAAPAVVYQKAGVKHPAMTRWTKDFWIGGAPGLVQIDHNLSYLAATKMLPNYDVARKPSEKAIASNYALWVSSKHDILERGIYTIAMGSAGGRQEIGPYPAWTVRWLYGGDPRMAEMAFGHADLFAGFPVHLREGQDRQYLRDREGSGLGKPVSIMARPTLMLAEGNGYINYAYTKAADKISYAGPVAANAWVPENSHQPAALYPQYLLTGDYWYLEEMLFWASWNAAGHNPLNLYYGRGPAGYYGGMVEQVRGAAWELRTRAETWAVLPDGKPEKKFVELLTNDALAIWEGSRGIHGAFDGTDLWQWGNKTASGLFAPDGASPLGWWEKGIAVSGLVDPSKAKSCTSPWMQHFLIYALGRAGELGFKTGPLLEYAARSVQGELATDGVDPNLYCAYRAATTKPDGTNITDWAEWAGAFQAYDTAAQCQSSLKDTEHGYAIIAIPAAAMAAGLPNGARAWDWLQQHIISVAALDDNPKWDILPRR